jgi:hypothetical protein
MGRSESEGKTFQLLARQHEIRDIIILAGVLAGS